MTATKPPAICRDAGYLEWLKRNPLPFFPSIAAKYGVDIRTIRTIRSGDDIHSVLADIPPQAWAEFEQEMAAWQERCRMRRMAQ